MSDEKDKQDAAEAGNSPFPSIPGTTAHASRVAFLVDARSYYSALNDALRQARRSVIILGWDMDSRVTLVRSESGSEQGPTFGKLLQEITRDNPELEVRLLNWQYPVFYAMGRQPLPRINPDWDLGERILYRLDDQHPQGAAHHQKIVVVDNKVAFVGGMDITHERWDTSDHHEDQPRRKNPDGQSYPPYHDVQMIVDGEAARAVSRIAADRWRWATGDSIPDVVLEEHAPWPLSVTPDLRDITITVSLTLPSFKDRAEVYEIEPLYGRAIEAASKSIYIENQYLTAESVRDALIAKLSATQGPDVVIILPTLPTGWIEQVAMVPLQEEVISALRQADKHGRLGVYCPFGEKDGKAPVKIHSKIMVVDDRFATIGSANLNHRSMGLDSECNLSVDAGNDLKAQSAIKRFRLGLLADHFGIDLESIDEEESEQDGMTAMVETLRKRTNQLLDYEESRGKLPFSIDAEQVRVLDPDRPLAFDATLDDFMDLDGSDQSSRGFMKLATVLFLLLGLLLTWRFTPLGEVLDKQTLLAWAAQLEHNAMLPYLLLGAYLVGGLIMFPVVLLILVTAALLEPWTAFTVSLTGSIGSAALGFFVGKLLGRDLVTRFMGKRMKPLKKHLKRHGIWAMTLLRIVPVAPFTVINMAAGATHLEFKSYMLGTFLGMFWGLATLTIFGSGIKEVLLDFDPKTFTLLMGLTMIVVITGILLKRRFNRLNSSPTGADAS